MTQFTLHAVAALLLSTNIALADSSVGNINVTDAAALDLNLQLTNSNSWAQECLSYFQLTGTFAPYQGANATPNRVQPSNYILRGMPSGLCADFIVTQFEECQLPSDEGIQLLANLKIDEESDVEETLDSAGVSLALPAFTGFPKSVKDIVDIVNYADGNNVPISVKTSGHSYAGR